MDLVDGRKLQYLVVDVVVGLVVDVVVGLVVDVVVGSGRGTSRRSGRGPRLRQSGWRSDRPMGGGLTDHKGSLEFGAGPKIEGVDKRGDFPTLGLIIFGASSQKLYSFEIFREISDFQRGNLA